MPSRRSMYGRLQSAALVVAVVACTPPVADRSERADSTLVVVYDGTDVRLLPGTKVRLAEQLAAFFQTCRPYEQVTRIRIAQDSLRRLWEEQRGGAHAIMTFSPREGTAGVDSGMQILVGLSALGAGPVLSRDGGDLVLYSKCDGLTGALVACDIHELAQADDAMADCPRLREIRRQLPTR